jgi:putative transposase
VLDLCSRLVVGWSMSSRMTAQLLTDALVMAVWRRGRPEALLHHSDQGSQYASQQFQRLLAAHGITCSMSRSGDVFDYVERFHNPRRRRSTLGYLSPVEYENAMGSAWDGANGSRANPSVGLWGWWRCFTVMRIPSTCSRV